MWEPYKKGFKAYLQLEKSLSGHSVEAYMGDVEKLTAFLQTTALNKTPVQIDLKDLQAFVKSIAELGITQ
ncbi:MAG TPA: site-specific integrase, partial [Chitinophagaceae bacterium]|nr:site-specific integrase [Chitinophagaceae bacterium]